MGPNGGTGAASGCTLQEIAALSAAKLAEQVRAVIAGQLGTEGTWEVEPNGKAL